MNRTPEVMLRRSISSLETSSVTGIGNRTPSDRCSESTTLYIQVEHPTKARSRRDLVRVIVGFVHEPFQGAEAAVHEQF